MEFVEESKFNFFEENRNI